MTRSAVVVALLLGGCAGAPVATPAAPAEAFFAAIAAHCGKAFAGRVVEDVPASATSPFANGPIVVHVSRCTADRLELPLHVGQDRSRTWVITRTATGLQLEHDHRHADGHPDAVTMYGGATNAPGTANRQAFPVDARSITLFQANDLPASVTNTWALEIGPGDTLAYELTRPGGRRFRLEFDLARPVPAPPAPWGHE
jgi:hypothetical protein